MGLLDFEWKKYNGQCSFGADAHGTRRQSNCDYAGKDNQLAPHFTGVLSAEHTAHLGSLALTTTVDVVHSSSYLESLNLDPMATQKGFTKLNARIGLGDLYDRWQVAVIGKNLTDETDRRAMPETRRWRRSCSRHAATTASWIRRAASRWN